MYYIYRMVDLFTRNSWVLLGENGHMVGMNKTGCMSAHCTVFRNI